MKLHVYIASLDIGLGICVGLWIQNFITTGTEIKGSVIHIMIRVKL